MNKGGTIAAGSPLSADTGAEILALGGNATDAAIAAALTSFHCEPLLSSGAGGGVMTAFDPNHGVSVLEFVPDVPGLGLAGPPELEFVPVSIDFGVARETYYVGRGAAATPAALIGLLDAHSILGKIPLKEVIAPAVRLCRGGFPVTASGAHFIKILEPIWRQSKECSDLYSTDDRATVEGETLINPAFANLLEETATEGRRLLTEGEVARRTVEYFGPEAGGLITPKDLASRRTRQLSPLSVSVFGGELMTPPPPTMGGVLIATSLAVLADQGLPETDFLGENHLTAIVNAELLSLYLRREILEPAGFSQELVTELTSDEGLKKHAALLGTIEPDGTPKPLDRGCTTHISVIDSGRGAASITLSNGEGCGHVIPGTGMHMNNFLGERDVNPAGFHVQPAGVTLSTMMSPTMFLKDGIPELVLGSGGSNRLRSAILQVTLNRLGFGRSLAESVDSSRIHLEENHLYAELPGMDQKLLSKLGDRFCNVSFDEACNVFFGGVHAVAYEQDGTLEGMGDPRRNGASRTVTS